MDLLSKKSYSLFNSHNRILNTPPDMHIMYIMDWFNELYLQSTVPTIPRQNKYPSYNMILTHPVNSVFSARKKNAWNQPSHTTTVNHYLSDEESSSCVHLILCTHNAYSKPGGGFC